MHKRCQHGFLGSGCPARKAIFLVSNLGALRESKHHPMPYMPICWSGYNVGIHGSPTECLGNRSHPQVNTWDPGIEGLPVARLRHLVLCGVWHPSWELNDWGTAENTEKEKKDLRIPPTGNGLQPTSDGLQPKECYTCLFFPPPKLRLKHPESPPRSSHVMPSLVIT